MTKLSWVIQFKYKLKGVVELELVFKKMGKILDSHTRASKNLKQSDYRRVIGDLHFVIENAQEIVYILNELIREKEEGQQHDRCIFNKN